MQCSCVLYTYKSAVYAARKYADEIASWGSTNFSKSELVKRDPYLSWANWSEKKLDATQRAYFAAQPGASDEQSEECE